MVYALSFGPACWISSRLGYGTDLLPTIYWPLVTTMRFGEEMNERQTCAAYSFAVGRPEKVPVVPSGRLAWFARIGAPAGWHWRYCAIYTIRPVASDDLRVRLRNEEWECSDRP